MKKLGHALLKIISVVLVIAIALEVINLFEPDKNVEDNPFIVSEGSLPMIAAHRGGGKNNPENTVLAFTRAVYNYEVEILESDLHLTADGYLVYNHDSYVDQTCNINGDITLDEVKELCELEENRHYIADMTLEELRQYNFGYYFEDENGERIYKDSTEIEANGLQIATVDQLFEMFYNERPNLRFIVEIKDSGERGIEACRILSSTLDMYPDYRDNIVVGTFHDEIELELAANYPELYRGASTGSAAKFILTELLRVNFIDDGDFACLQIPTSYQIKGIELNLAKRAYIRQAHRRGIAVQYWTINDEDEMRDLIDLGCDCIMTDDPALLRAVLSEY